LVLRFYAGLTVEETADVLACDPGRWRPGTGVNRRARFHFVLRLRGGWDRFGDVGGVAAGDGVWL
jgi:hypothetical protein